MCFNVLFCLRFNVGILFPRLPVAHKKQATREAQGLQCPQNCNRPLPPAFPGKSSASDPVEAAYSGSIVCAVTVTVTVMCMCVIRD